MRRRPKRTTTLRGYAVRSVTLDTSSSAYPMSTKSPRPRQLSIRHPDTPQSRKREACRAGKKRRKIYPAVVLSLRYLQDRDWKGLGLHSFAGEEVTHERSIYLCFPNRIPVAHVDNNVPARVFALLYRAPYYPYLFIIVTYINAAAPPTFRFGRS